MVFHSLHLPSRIRVLMWRECRIGECQCGGCSDLRNNNVTNLFLRSRQLIVMKALDRLVKVISTLHLKLGTQNLLLVSACRINLGL